MNSCAGSRVAFLVETGKGSRHSVWTPCSAASTLALVVRC